MTAQQEWSFALRRASGGVGLVEQYFSLDAFFKSRSLGSFDTFGRRTGHLVAWGKHRREPTAGANGQSLFRRLWAQTQSAGPSPPLESQALEMFARTNAQIHSR